MKNITMKDDDYGSDEWDDMDQDLIAAVDEAEQLASSSSKTLPKQDRWGNDKLFLEDDFDDLDDDGIQSAAVPKLVSFTYPTPPKRETQEDVYYPSLVKSMSTLANEDPAAPEDVKVKSNQQKVEDNPRDGSGSIKKQRRSRRKSGAVVTKNEESTIINKGKRKFSEQDKDGGEIRQKIEYTGTIFPRLTMAYEEDLADAVGVAEFSLRLMQILTSLLREFLETNINSYPQRLRQDAANNINKMVRQRKADDSFHGWDFLALANFIIYQRQLLPLSIRNPGGIIERLQVLKTTMRWTIAHTSLEEQERKHPIELSLWAINTLLLIENLGVPMSYAARVIALNRRLWSNPPESSSSMSEASSGEN